jgi:hypothetical protein
MQGACAGHVGRASGGGLSLLLPAAPAPLDFNSLSLRCPPPPSPSCSYYPLSRAEFVACVPEDACLGGPEALCAPLYTGARCAECHVGAYRCVCVTWWGIRNGAQPMIEGSRRSTHASSSYTHPISPCPVLHRREVHGGCRHC